MSNQQHSDEDIFNEIDEAIEANNFDTFANKLNTALHLVNARFKDGATLLHTAASVGNEQIVTMLIEKGVYFNVKDIEDRTPLHYAILQEKEDIAKLLIRFISQINDETVKNNIINAKDIKGRSPLDYAILCGEYDIAEFLIQYGSSISEATIEIAQKKVEDDPLNVVEYALKLGHFQMALFLIEKGAQISNEVEVELQLNLGLFSLGSDSSTSFNNQMLLAPTSP